MKKIILVFTAATVFVACGSKQEKTLATETDSTTAVAPAPVVIKEVHYVNSAPAQQAEPAKKGWSKGAKGAVIGGAGGAVVGAAVSKKKGKGALIGAAVGAGTGYIIGRSEDKKDGRVK